MSGAFTELTEEAKRSSNNIELKEIQICVDTFFSTLCSDVDDHFLETLDTNLIQMFEIQQKKSEEHYISSIKIFLTKFMVENVEYFKSSNKVKCVSIGFA